MSRTSAGDLPGRFLVAAALLCAGPALAQPPLSGPNDGGVGTTAAPSPLETLTRVPAPLPGSIAEELAREFDARDGFATPAPRGSVYSFLPNTLLWEPGLAVKRDPRLQFLASTLKNYRGDIILDTAIGGTIGLFRYDFPERGASAQLDIFGLVITRLSTNDLVADDYRFGVPLTWRSGDWSGKLGYEHTSAHIGDKQLQNRGGLVTRSFAKDEFALGLSRILYGQLRLFGHLGYAFGFQVPDVETTVAHRGRADVGFEWYDRTPTGFRGTPFVAGDAEWRGDQGGNANIALQVGWLWKNPHQRLGTARVFVELYCGRSPYGEFIRERENYVAVGFGFDY